MPKMFNEDEGEVPEMVLEKIRVRMQKALDDAGNMLKSAGFDACVVAGSFVNENGETELLSSNFGNFYAQNGMMTYMLKKRQHTAVIESERDNSDSDD